MDDEDFGEFGFAPHALRTKSDFQSAAKEGNTAGGAGDGSRGGAAAGEQALSHLIQPTRTTIGEQLLKAQGWKPGQGIGPKSIKKLKMDMRMSYAKTFGEARNDCPDENADE